MTEIFSPWLRYVIFNLRMFLFGSDDVSKEDVCVYMCPSLSWHFQLQKRRG